MFLLKDTTQWRRWRSNPGPFGLNSSTLLLSHCAPVPLILNQSLSFIWITYKKCMYHSNINVQARLWQNNSYCIGVKLLTSLPSNVSAHNLCKPIGPRWGPTKRWAWLRPEVIKLFSYSTQLIMTFIMRINVKMPTIVCIFIFLSMTKTTSEHLKARKIFIFKHFRFYKHLKFHAQLSWARQKFYNLEAWIQSVWH